jgi:enoyl-CoA hydratase
MDTLIIQKDAGAPGVVVVTLNRPQVLNAVDTPTWTALDTQLRQLAFDDELRCLVFTGAGPRAFCAGGDLKERNGMSDRAWALQHQLIEGVLLAIREFPRPTIAAVHGITHGGGFELALMCDFVIADETADFALPETRLGFLPGGGGLQNLARCAGVRRAKQLLYTGSRIDARTAFEWNVANEIVPAGAHLARAMAVAADIAAAAPLAVRSAKQALQNGVDTDFRTGYALDLAFHYMLVRSEDRLEGIRAFNEKRPARWSGR